MPDAELARMARAQLGPQWKRRVLSALSVLADGGAALEAAGSGNISSAIRDVCDALRRLEEAGGVW